jgi:hypothetical protein
MRRAASNDVSIAIDRTFEPNDAFRATMFAASQPVVLEPAHAPASVPPPSSRRATAPVAAIERERRTVWWPLVLVGFFAVAFATVAFLKSPLAKHPRIAPYANAALAQIG